MNQPTESVRRSAAGASLCRLTVAVIAIVLLFAAACWAFYPKFKEPPTPDPGTIPASPYYVRRGAPLPVRLRRIPENELPAEHCIDNIAFDVAKLMSRLSDVESRQTRMAEEVTELRRLVESALPAEEKPK